jgi:hypothetical protein
MKILAIMRPVYERFGWFKVDVQAEWQSGAVTKGTMQFRTRVEAEAIKPGHEQHEPTSGVG